MSLAVARADRQSESRKSDSKASRAMTQAARARAEARSAACREVDPSRVEAFMKTKLCRFYAAGTCCKGSACSYAHETTELHPVPNLTRTKMCRTLTLRGACKDPD